MRTLQLYLKLSTKSFKLGFCTILDPSVICKLSPSWRPHMDQWVGAIS